MIYSLGVALALHRQERLFQFLKPRAYSAIERDFLDKPLKPVALLLNVNRT